MEYVTLAPHAVRPQKKDKIFENSQKAKKAIAEYGEDAVINATLGECIDDNGDLMVLPMVEEKLKAMPAREMFSYAPISGVEGFREAVEQSLLGDDNRGFYLEAVPTPGGCGALRHVVWNFLEMGESVLTTEYFWGPYRGICEEHGRKLETFEMFNEKGTFNLEALDAKLADLTSRQKRQLVILNTPANNPTGYSMTPQEMKGVADLVKKYAKDPEQKITLCLDVSYIEYDEEFEESRKIFDELKDLPENTMLTVVFSMSKSFTMCGMRCGAVVCLSPTKEAAESFKAAMSFSSRSTWSNVIRSAQKVLVEICLDPKQKEEADNERRKFAQTITYRGKTFMAEAEKAGLKCCPYKHGFFITIPYKDPQKLADELQKELIFVVPLEKGIRFSPCAVTEDKCKKAPAAIARAIKNLEE